MNDLARYKLIAAAAVPPAAKLLYGYLLDSTGGRHKSVYLSSTKMAIDVGFSPSTVRRNLHRLQSKGLIRIIARYSEEGIQLANQITIL
ncbi:MULTISPECIES: helix-turn-helix domain-containing protein [Paenibacillus]|uniref:Helix-turn-helix domain-containing protein n=1 Tax=Paenibacillus woosongensis TaxID=307580 RepID=A0AA95I9U9_9BACL|nr:MULTISPECIES: helix-turn-helix domain-containing protein [Paenibacillus]WHX49999.1 helix-turn-helix domain-containing protein [Paenibacillus woosongensis]SHE11461.1 Uncharacterised protein [Chlamydia abortus]